MVPSYTQVKSVLGFKIEHLEGLLVLSSKGIRLFYDIVQDRITLTADDIHYAKDFDRVRTCVEAIKRFRTDKLSDMALLGVIDFDDPDDPDYVCES